jgi:YcxB-like protein
VSPSEYTLHYASTRSEIWRAYWREWTRIPGLWRFHVLLGLAVGFVVADRGNLGQFSPERFAIAGLVTMGISILLLSLWTQVRFKPQTRLLTLNADGFTTAIGAQSGQRRWQDIQRVEDHDGTILIVSKNGNAMIIPRRAFASDADRQSCFVSIQQWYEAATV